MMSKKTVEVNPTHPTRTELKEARRTSLSDMKDLSSQIEQKSWKLLARSHRNVFRNESWTDIPQVAGTDHQVFSKPHNKLRTRVVVLDMHNVEDPASREHSRGEDAQKSSRRRCKERRLIQTTINLTKINQMSKQVETPQIQCSAEADHQSLESYTASLEHVKTSRRLYISRRDQAANR